MRNNLANYITIFRLLVILPLSFFLIKGYDFIAALIYLVAAFSDLLDGYVARKNKIVTTFGILMDPIADKLIYITSLIIFLERGYIPFWSVLIVSFREILITGLRSVCYVNGKIFPAVKAGKIKAFIQQFSFFFILIFKRSFPTYICMIIIVIITLQSLYNYLIRIASFLKENH